MNGTDDQERPTGWWASLRGAGGPPERRRPQDGHTPEAATPADVGASGSDTGPGTHTDGAEPAVGNTGPAAQPPGAGTAPARPDLPPALDLSPHPDLPPAPLDVLAPWGPQGPPPSDAWREDILGPGFESRTIPLLPDDQGEAVATLVRHLPERDPGALPGTPIIPRFVALYIHGRNDYFFQVELARVVSAAGGAFHALDLRKYGRSLRPGQTIGFASDLSVYDEDIGEALDLIREDVGRLPLVLMGHSTGGLTVTLWAYRHPGAVAAVVLNSAWLEMQTLASVRSTVQPVLGRIAARNPLWAVPTGGGKDFYSRSLLEGWAGSGFGLPRRLLGYEGDPAVAGWTYATQWKRPDSYPAYAQWLEAILLAQEQVEKHVHLDCPVLSMCSTSSFTGDTWSPEVFDSDVVLDVDVIVERSATLGPLVTIARFPGRHDLFLSDPDVRADIWSVMGHWFSAFV
ncbi:alpha/beta fold hydrolase [Actinomyces sp.]|uniref:alpha/beta hydrolase n=1 Tax=Actinomyces sp. TaxID=29317 RepID=UPI00289BF794|nr:alpha/beta fold hydrolase [Actinomyces sp.]